MLLKGQRDISAQIPMPSDAFYQSSYPLDRSAETISFYYFDTQSKSVAATGMSNPSGTLVRMYPGGGMAYTKNQKIIITASNRPNLLGEWTIVAVASGTNFDIDVGSQLTSMFPIDSATCTIRASIPVRTADSSQVAGTVVVGQTQKRGILDVSRNNIASYRDTSFAWITGVDGEVFPNNQMKEFPYAKFGAVLDMSAYDKAVQITDGFSNGDWTMDFRTGQFWGKKATTAASDTCNYTGAVSSLSDDPFYQWQRTYNVPIASSVNALTNSNSTALEASRVVKASAGRLYKLFVYNNEAQANFIQIHNTASVPAEGVVPFWAFPIAASSFLPYPVDFDVYGLYLSTGITIVNSTTANTKTLGGANLLIMAQYV